MWGYCCDRYGRRSTTARTLDFGGVQKCRNRRPLQAPLLEATEARWSSNCCGVLFRGGKVCCRLATVRRALRWTFFICFLEIAPFSITIIIAPFSWSKTKTKVNCTLAAIHQSSNDPVSEAWGRWEQRIRSTVLMGEWQNRTFRPCQSNDERPTQRGRWHWTRTWRSPASQSEESEEWTAYSAPTPPRIRSKNNSAICTIKIAPWVAVHLDSPPFRLWIRSWGGGAPGFTTLRVLDPLVGWWCTSIHHPPGYGSAHQMAGHMNLVHQMAVSLVRPRFRHTDLFMRRLDATDSLMR